MKRGKIDHYFQQDGGHIVHIIPENGIFNVYYQIDDSEMLWALGLPVYQEYEDKYYSLEEIFEIAWNNFPNHEYMFEDNYDE